MFCQEAKIIFLSSRAELLTQVMEVSPEHKMISTGDGIGVLLLSLVWFIYESWKHRPELFNLILHR